VKTKIIQRGSFLNISLLSAEQEQDKAAERLKKEQELKKKKEEENSLTLEQIKQQVRFPSVLSFSAPSKISGERTSS
jgi:hypothetical protein